MSTLIQKYQENGFIIKRILVCKLFPSVTFVMADKRNGVASLPNTFCSWADFIATSMASLMLASARAMNLN